MVVSLLFPSLTRTHPHPIPGQGHSTGFAMPCSTEPGLEKYLSEADSCPDLYVVSGGNQFPCSCQGPRRATAGELKSCQSCRLYVTDGFDAQPKTLASAKAHKLVTEIFFQLKNVQFVLGLLTFPSSGITHLTVWLRRGWHTESRGSFSSHHTTLVKTSRSRINLREADFKPCCHLINLVSKGPVRCVPRPFIRRCRYLFPLPSRWRLPPAYAFAPPVPCHFEDCLV